MKDLRYMAYAILLTTISIIRTAESAQQHPSKRNLSAKLLERMESIPAALKSHIISFLPSTAVLKKAYDALPIWSVELSYTAPLSIKSQHAKTIQPHHWTRDNRYNLAGATFNYPLQLLSIRNDSSLVYGHSTDYHPDHGQRIVIASSSKGILNKYLSNQWHLPSDNPYAVNANQYHGGIPVIRQRDKGYARYELGRLTLDMNLEDHVRGFGEYLKNDTILAMNNELALVRDMNSAHVVCKGTRTLLEDADPTCIALPPNGKVVAYRSLKKKSSIVINNLGSNQNLTYILTGSAHVRCLMTNNMLVTTTEDIKGKQITITCYGKSNGWQRIRQLNKSSIPNRTYIPQAIDNKNTVMLLQCSQKNNLGLYHTCPVVVSLITGTYTDDTPSYQNTLLCSSDMSWIAGKSEQGISILKITKFELSSACPLIRLLCLYEFNKLYIQAKKLNALCLLSHKQYRMYQYLKRTLCCEMLHHWQKRLKSKSQDIRKLYHAVKNLS